MRARLAQGADARAARAALAEGGRARLPVLGEVLLADGRTAALCEARFVALPAGAGGDA
ncbi:MAG: hypothetical protein RML12_11190 [Xanthomonadales bacterium]|nr:hypothetical protein [Xanthomonadales bacterium]